MRLAPRPLFSLGAVVLFAASVSCGGGGDGGSGPPAVASVLITSPGAPPTFQTLTRTAQFTAVARDASTATIAGATISWNSSNTAVATVNGSGLVTATGNGTTNITATSSGISSTAVLVTVAQVAANLNITPTPIHFGALGSTKQLAAGPVDSSGAAVAGGGAVVWSRAGAGANASVSAGGLVTSLAVGTGDTAVATLGGQTSRAVITVTQVVAQVVVSPTQQDTLRTTGRQKQFTAVARDSQANVMAGAAINWSSTATGVATVGAGTGLATAVADGSTNIQATSGGVSGSRTLVIRRYAQNFSLTPTPTATITTPNGTQLFLGTAEDSVPTALPITWTSRANGIATVSANGNATAIGNGVTYIVMSAGTRTDSTQLTVSGQPTFAMARTVTVGPSNQFVSVNNGTGTGGGVNVAVDTIGVGGTITWQGAGGVHTVESTGSPSFTSSVGTLGNNMYQFIFTAAGTYTYDCSIHGASMTGRIVVR